MWNIRALPERLGLPGERVRRAQIACQIISRYAPQAVMSPAGRL